MFRLPSSIPGVLPNSTLSRPGRDGVNALCLLEAGTESSVVEMWYTCIRQRGLREPGFPRLGGLRIKTCKVLYEDIGILFSVFWLILLALPGEQLTCTVLFHLAPLHGPTAAGVVTKGLVGLCALSPDLGLLSLLW